MSRRRSPRTTIGALAPAVLAIATASIAAPGAAQSPAASISLVDQTLVVTDEPAHFDLDVANAPDGARVAVEILAEPARTRAEVRQRHRRAPTGGSRLASFECTLTGDCFEQAFLSTDDTGVVTITVNDGEIGEILRRDEGALTVTVELRAEDGERLDGFVTSLLVFHSSTNRRARVAFVSSLAAPVAHRPDQSLSIDPQPLLDRIDQVPADVAVTFDLRPETLTALLETDPEALGVLLNGIGGRPLLRSPWVAMDEEAWRVVGEADRVVAQYALGTDTVERIAATSPTAIARLDPDATPATLSLLRAAGTSAVIVDDDQLEPVARTRPADRPLRILDDNGVAMTALRVDRDLHDTLALDEPELAARHAIAELLVDVHDDGAGDAAILLELDAIDPLVVDELLTVAAASSEIRIDTVADLANVDPQRLAGTPERAELRPTPPPDVTPIANDLRAAESAIATLSAMLEPDTETVDILTNQLRAAVSSDLTPAEAEAYADVVFAEVLARTTGIEIPAGDRITLTDRRTDLPLRIVNNQGVALNVELVLSAEKLRFPDGERRTLQLQPGNNDLVIPVETLASGDARVTATVVSPGGAFELATGTVDIRSTAISGLGLAISIVALAILAAWWIRTIFRVRRNRAAATVAPAHQEGES